MTMAELIHLLSFVNGRNDLMALNEGGFPDDSRPDLLLGLTSELFFVSNGSLAMKQKAVELAENYYRECDPVPDRLVQGDYGMTLRSVEDIRRNLMTSRTDDPTEGDMADQMTDRGQTLSFYMRALTAGKRSAPSYGNLSCLVDGEGYRGGGSLIAWNNRVAAAVDGASGFVDSFVRRCEAFKVHYAVSGLALLFATYSSYAPVDAFPLYQRFPGLLYADGGAFSLEAERRDDVICDVNWLTAISDAMFERVGGEAAARRALGPEVVRHPFHGGVLFQAGPQPRLGDINMGDVPDAYRQVARFLKPLRFDGWTPPFFLRVPSGVDKGEATRAWLARFD